MKTRTTGLVLVFLLLAVATSTAGDDSSSNNAGAPVVEWHKFDDAIVAAKSADKHVMVDVYTDWCTWCKKLDAETYTDSRVRRVLADSYISAKIKGDSGGRLKVQGLTKREGKKTLLQFVPTAEAAVSARDLTRKQLRISGYPTILFLAADGRMITSLPGFHNAESLTKILNFIKDDLYEVMSYKDYLESLDKAEAQDRS